MSTDFQQSTHLWKQGVNAGQRHWVRVPGAVKGINAGNAERAALIVAAVTAYQGDEHRANTTDRATLSLIAALEAYVSADDIGARIQSPKYVAARAALAAFAA